MSAGREPSGASGPSANVPATSSAGLTGLAGIRVGLYTDDEQGTGCAAIVFDADNVAAAEVRGAAPGTREYALLQPGMTVQSINAIVLAGGSALGLAAADGVAQAMRADGIGYPTQFGTVPIVPAAVVYDLSVGDPTAAPTAADGERAYRAATTDPIPNGRFGPGTGCSISKWRAAPQPGGLGNALVSIGGVTVAALAVVNATGDLFDLDGTALSGGPHRPTAPDALAYGENTTLVVVATNAVLHRTDLQRVIVRAHDALGACIRPAHTRYDGDICFAVSVRSGGVAENDSAANAGNSTTPTARDLDAAGEAAFAAVGAAIAASIGGPSGSSR